MSENRSRDTTRDADSLVLSVSALVLVSLFITALVTAQLTAAKVIEFTLPVAIPVAGSSLAMPGAALAYTLTFFASDCITELYGKRSAQMVVNVGFFMNIVLLALVWSTIWAPAAQSNAVDPETFQTVLGASTNIVLGSLTAYLLSQNWDVFVFHWLREATGGAQLWLRNIGSTATSQLIDTVVFVGIGFVVAPVLLDTGAPLSGSAVASLVVGQYLLKLLIALLDTPFVYAVVGYVRSNRSKTAVTA
ncbi:queuosine precursor transporter [Halocatena pleomorpha]|uniref:Probable queuosine precursor transporter n=1 Tax=Halocatena pleomorpha TaxID=1785090 RepID=A0A3P3R349_9EURY|nr:queuosine precursor transporter [Halocatena pleomorpha]RRJ27774.1 VUT family protein [Halocatena pleomorpha]